MDWGRCKPTLYKIRRVVITEKPEPDAAPGTAGHNYGEVPVITIENDSSAEKASASSTITRFAVCSAVLLLCIAGIFSLHLAHNYMTGGMPVSVSPSKNIAALKSASKKSSTGITKISEEILGVDMDIYSLDGLQAVVTMQRPDTTDKSVMLYTRSADYTPSGKLLGSVVAQGKILNRSRIRLGYCAMANGDVVIGVGRCERVMRYAKNNGGSFFRQFVLLSDGQIPGKFYLHGKVERRTLARFSNDKLYYIQTQNPETLWDFADALREYGFINAIYITDGTEYCYYRTADGTRHDLGTPAPTSASADLDGVRPWLVFREK